MKLENYLRGSFNKVSCEPIVNMLEEKNAIPDTTSEILDDEAKIQEEQSNEYSYSLNSQTTYPCPFSQAIKETCSCIKEWICLFLLYCNGFGLFWALEFSLSTILGNKPLQILSILTSYCLNMLFMAMFMVASFPYMMLEALEFLLSKIFLQIVWLIVSIIFRKLEENRHYIIIFVSCKYGSLSIFFTSQYQISCSLLFQITSFKQSLLQSCIKFTNEKIDKCTISPRRSGKGCEMRKEVV